MLRQLLTLGAGLFLIGLAGVAWKLRLSTKDGYRAMWKAMYGGRWADSSFAEADAAQGAYGIVSLSAALGMALLVSAAIP
jgi:hypothetical protein